MVKPRRKTKSGTPTSGDSPPGPSGTPSPETRTNPTAQPGYQTPPNPQPATATDLPTSVSQKEQDNADDVSVVTYEFGTPAPLDTQPSVDSQKHDPKVTKSSGLIFPTVLSKHQNDLTIQDICEELGRLILTEDPSTFHPENLLGLILWCFLQVPMRDDLPSFKQGALLKALYEPKLDCFRNLEAFIHTFRPNRATTGIAHVLRTFQTFMDSPDTICMIGYLDADHAGEQLTRRSRTGYIMMLNSAPILWFSKRQGGIEGASFGSEFMAMKTAVEANRGFRYKLRMMGVPIEGPTYMYGDNMSVLHNVQKPESTLKKKSNSIAYHFVREAVAMGEALPGYVNTRLNVADLMTKALPYGELREFLIRMLLWDIYPEST
mmetsp:Transcript_53440/g.130084  ORF Transcript_53440/g.130084 Transcript_53440/m.130084 type:complete len:377 (-) Transcript_53440:80-1210(-)|eukprot:CAMPEP_0113448474 /NCGR_PEP_ID=MMETSP0014_2-20120614/4785_1 /TAXON_ID=2857 /ORGANISM="Nitzschia sp." /LENGTH=376 /DNA_ID=CAMNT_0000339687 /DNA_START=1271 /DNA_END=2401 /DNA_ORIENTATION=- /assembly_acc=CAM_ASM_000159